MYLYALWKRLKTRAAAPTGIAGGSVELVLSALPLSQRPQKIRLVRKRSKAAANIEVEGTEIAATTIHGPYSPHPHTPRPVIKLGSRTTAGPRTQTRTQTQVQTFTDTQTSNPALRNRHTETSKPGGPSRPRWNPGGEYGWSVRFRWQLPNEAGLLQA